MTAKRGGRKAAAGPRGLAIYLPIWHGVNQDYECVGRLVWHGRRREYILEHEHTASQRHLITASPGGYDAALLGYMVANNIWLVCDIEVSGSGAERRQVPRWADVETIVSRGHFRTDAGRFRFYLPYTAWVNAEKDYQSPPATLPRVNLAENWLCDLVDYMDSHGLRVPERLREDAEAVRRQVAGGGP